MPAKFYYLPTPASMQTLLTALASLDPTEIVSTVADLDKALAAIVDALIPIAGDVASEIASK